jgi:hypothetical protein
MDSTVKLPPRKAAKSKSSATAHRFCCSLACEKFDQGAYLPVRIQPEKYLS